MYGGGEISGDCMELDLSSSHHSNKRMTEEATLLSLSSYASLISRISFSLICPLGR